MITHKMLISLLVRIYLIPVNFPHILQYSIPAEWNNYVPGIHINLQNDKLPFRPTGSNHANLLAGSGNLNFENNYLCTEI